MTYTLIMDTTKALLIAIITLMVTIMVAIYLDVLNEDHHIKNKEVLVYYPVKGVVNTIHHAWVPADKAAEFLKVANEGIK